MKKLILIFIITVVFTSCKKSDDSNADQNSSETTKVATVTSKTGRIWMDRNLGAAQVAKSTTDAASFGDYYQWGRGSDGHQLQNSKVVDSSSPIDKPTNNYFFSGNIKTPFDWRQPQNIDLWQGVNGINNPCPAGFRIPNIVEWDEEVKSWSSYSAEGAFNSPLKLPTTGSRSYINGLMLDYGTGTYWSSSTSGVESYVIKFRQTPSSQMYSSKRGNGICIRCIKN
jgi:hypothetical protein